LRSGGGVDAGRPLQSRQETLQRTCAASTARIEKNEEEMGKGEVKMRGAELSARNMYNASLALRLHFSPLGTHGRPHFRTFTQ